MGDHLARPSAARLGAVAGLQARLQVARPSPGRSGWCRRRHSSGRADPRRAPRTTGRSRAQRGGQPRCRRNPRPTHRAGSTCGTWRRTSKPSSSAARPPDFPPRSCSGGRGCARSSWTRASPTTAARPRSAASSARTARARPLRRRRSSCRSCRRSKGRDGAVTAIEPAGAFRATLAGGRDGHRRPHPARRRHALWRAGRAGPVAAAVG